jgi:hypothetical protein
VLERLEQKRLRSRGIFGDFPEEVLKDPATLPPHDCRIVFRDVVRATDRRTMTTCLAPPRIFVIHIAPQLIFARGDERDVLYVLAVLNSLPYDWLLRRRVETHVTFGILNSLPVPEAPSGHARLSELAGRLSIVDERYDDFVRRAGIEPEPLDPGDRAEAEAEIDALVAHAYGLSEDDLRVIFEDFNEQALSAAQRELILAHFRGAA